MSGIKNISASNPVPTDLAKRLGENGIGIILSTFWLGYHDLRIDGRNYSVMDEDSITVEWYAKIYDRWTSENRAAQVNLKLIPINQYPDHTLKAEDAPGKAPTIDFCFRVWNDKDSYFGAECKRLSIGQNRLIKEYVINGVQRFTSGKRFVKGVLPFSNELRHKQYHIFIMLFDHNQSGTDCGLYFGNDIFPLNKGINRRCVFRQYLP